MDADDVRERVAEITDLAAGDHDERAGVCEDALYKDVLAAIAEGEANAADLAVEALKADDVEFSRYCA